METERRIANLYDMFYPYGQYTGDSVTACYWINRELKSLCRQENCDRIKKLLLVLIAKSLGYRYTSDVKTEKICQDIQDWLYKTCMKLPDIDRSRFLVALKTGTLTERIRHDYKKYCIEFMDENIILYNQKYYPVINQLHRIIFIYEWNYLVAGRLALPPLKIKEMIKQGKQLEVFNMGIENNKDKLNVEWLQFNKSYLRGKAEFVIDIIDRMSKGQIPIDITRDKL